MILHSETIKINEVKIWSIYNFHSYRQPMGDITLRAIYILKQFRLYTYVKIHSVSKKLLDKYEIKSKLISNHKFNEKKNLSKTIEIFKLIKMCCILNIRCWYSR